MSYLEDAWLPHVRLSILRVLAVAPGYCANSSVLQDSLTSLGLRATRDQVRAELHWLADLRLISSLEAAAGLFVATLTERGADVASGVAQVPGIQRPSPA